MRNKEQFIMERLKPIKSIKENNENDEKSIINGEPNQST